MSSNKMATKADLQEMYSRILPYLGGSADAGFTPIGTIIAVFSETAPANYLICDGATYNKADYPELAAHLLALTTHSQYEVSGDSTKFKVPDLRGEFLRGTGTNSQATGDNGANVGVHQSPSEIPASLWIDNTTAAYPKVASNSNPDIPINAVNITTKTDAIGMKVSTDGALSNQTLRYYAVHPTNTSVLYCIAVKNIYYGSGGGSSYEPVIEEVTTFPTATAELSGKVVLYVGENSDEASGLVLRKGVQYRCTNAPDGGYGWFPNSPNITEGYIKCGTGILCDVTLPVAERGDLRCRLRLDSTATPTSGSEKPFTAGGAYTELNKKQSKINYSTSEQSTGITWTNGSTIYQKTINFGSLPNATSKSVSHGISGLSTNKVVKLEGIVVNSSYAYSIPWVAKSNDNDVQMYIDGSNINISCDKNCSGDTGYITVWYYK